MADKNDANIVDEVEKRLDDLFGDGDESSDDFEEEGGSVEGPTALEEGGSDVEDTPLKELKSIVLSIDWEITDEIMTKFLDQVDGLKDAYKDDKIIQMFLQLLGSVGKYIKAKKASADPDVVRLLNTAYTGLEKVLLTENMAEAERKKLLLTEVNKFKKLKERLTGKPTREAEKTKTPPAAKGPIAKEQEGISAPAEKEPADEEKEKEAIVEKVTVPSGRKGMGVGSKIALFVSLPLIIVAAIGFVYTSQLTDITSQINQTLRTVTGAPVEEAKDILFIILFGLVILFGLIAAFYGSRLAGKIKSLTNVVDRISAGETDVEIETKAGGEIGALADAIGRMRDNLL